MSARAWAVAVAFASRANCWPCGVAAKIKLPLQQHNNGITAMMTTFCQRPPFHQRENHPK
jgi:hypothetical protein